MTVCFIWSHVDSRRESESEEGLNITRLVMIIIRRSTKKHAAKLCVSVFVN